MVLPPISKPVVYLPAKLYEFSVRSRISLYERGILKIYRLNAPVISVGNLTVGGTGKTPCVAFLAQMLRDEGLDAAILSRGYKRSSEGRIEVSNGKEILCEPHESGDEPYLLAKTCRGVRVVVDRDRYEAGSWLEERAPVSVFLLDDGYQHLRLARDLNLLLVDATEDLSTAKMVPFGRLREPLAGLRRADAIVVTRSDQQVDRGMLEKTIRRYARENISIFYADHQMTNLLKWKDGVSLDPAGFTGKRVAALSGIARPDRFHADLAGFGMEIVLRREFEDHYRYSQEEFLKITECAQKARAEAIVTTEKDAANLPADFVNQSTMPLFIARIEFRCENEAALRALILGVVHRNEDLLPYSERNQR